MNEAQRHNKPFSFSHFHSPVISPFSFSLLYLLINQFQSGIEGMAFRSLAYHGYTCRLLSCFPFAILLSFNRKDKSTVLNASGFCTDYVGYEAQIPRQCGFNEPRTKARCGTFLGFCMFLFYGLPLIKVLPLVSKLLSLTPPPPQNSHTNLDIPSHHVHNYAPPKFLLSSPSRSSPHSISRALAQHHV